ncbi:MAG: DUF2157 domain-containing protein [bacterium]|nr:DUF2157 domain-containing protein [Gammaproteobacteria bacterium]HIL98117.1 DUF2157 domain-containing protein [Pseudomonadales bacterium]
MRLIRLLKSDLARETAEWVGDDVITVSQAEEICARYGADYHQASSRSLGYNVLVVFGYLFIGLAVITLLGANWDDIPRALRMGGLVVLTACTQGFAVYLNSQGKQSVAVGIFLLGNLFFGASIILIAQIYHLGEHMPDGVFWWALGCLPFGLLTKNPLITLQANLLAIIWFYLEVSVGFYPTLFPVFIMGSLFVLYRGQGSILLLLTSVASIGLWMEYALAEIWRSSRHFTFEPEHVAVSVASFILLYTFSHWLNQRNTVATQDYGAVLSVWSLRFGLLFLLVFSFEDPWESLINANWEHLPSTFAFVGVLAMSALLLAYRSSKLKIVASILVFYLASFLAVLLTENDVHAPLFQLMYNLALISAGVTLIIKGIHSGISHYFFLGIATILLVALMRYIDLIGDYVGGAMLFILCATLLLGAARYWKGYLAKGDHP